MDFELSEDQEALRELVRAIVAGRFPLERIRRAEEADLVVDRDDWSALGEAGVFSLTVAEDAGGAGLGMADAAVVFEELGRGLVPGPLVTSHLAAGLLGSAPDGSTVVGDVRAPGPGTPCLVEHLFSLDALVVRGDHPAVIDGDELTALVSSASAVERPLDPLTPMAVVPDLPTGRPLDVDSTRAFERDHRILTGALCVGMAAACCTLAVDYAKGRRQFGRPIGSFQAVKHLCADMLVRSETARAAVQAAAVAVDQPGVGDAERMAAGGALVAVEAAVQNAKTCIQVHGGMGFTWEVPAHLYLMRARTLWSSLGPTDDLTALVAARF